MGEENVMETRSTDQWLLGQQPTIAMAIPDRMQALTIHRDRYGAPAKVIGMESVPTPKLRPEDANKVLVSVLASGPNFNTNFAALGLPVPVFGRVDPATIHIPGSDALGIVVDAGPAVKSVRLGQAVILDAWTLQQNIRGYETHDGFNGQFVATDQQQAILIPEALKANSPEQLAAMLLTYGTAYRAVVQLLAVRPGDSILVMGGGRGTSFPGAQIAKLLGARVILFGSNPALAKSLIERGIADAFIDRRALPAEMFKVLAPDEDFSAWRQLTEPFRQAVYEANNGRLVDKVFEHTGGRNFPLLISALANGGHLAFFGATGSGLKGEYKETFFYGKNRYVFDARWVWMRQKQIAFRNGSPDTIFDEMSLLPGRRGLIWGADAYAAEFVQAAFQRGAEIVVIASRKQEAEGIQNLLKLGIPETHLIDRDQFALQGDMPDPLTDAGAPNPEYGPNFMQSARDLSVAVRQVFGPGISPDFVVDRPDQSTLHLSAFLARDYNERDEMPSSWIVVRGDINLSICGSHMYRAGQAQEVLRLLSDKRIVMDQSDLEITSLAGLPEIQQKMLDGKMSKPKGVALVQADRAGRAIAEYEADYLGKSLLVADPGHGRNLSVGLCDGVAIITITRPDALNALGESLLSQIEEIVAEVEIAGTIKGNSVRAIVLRGYGRAFMAGADIGGFLGASASVVGGLAAKVIEVFGRLERLRVPVVALVDGVALGGGNEFAMSAHYRIVTENALLGQPEIKLGIMPGYGGMQRLPRLVGPRKAAELALNGEPIDGHRAVALGLADAFCPAASALRLAFNTALRIAAGEIELPRRDWDRLAAAQKGELSELLSSTDAASLLAAPAPDAGTAGDLKAARAYAGRIALEALQAGYARGFAAGLANDARLFGAVTSSRSGQFWVERFLNKDPRQSASLTLLPPT